MFEHRERAQRQAEIGKLVASSVNATALVLTEPDFYVILRLIVVVVTMVLMVAIMVGW
jgi:hypothetical protein